MWDEGDVGNAADLVTTGIQRTYGGLTTRARALHINVEVFQTIFQCSLASTLGCNLCSKGSAFPRTAETGATGSRPAQSIALDRKSTRLNSSHVRISYAVFCLKKKKDHTSVLLS